MKRDGGHLAKASNLHKHDREQLKENQVKDRFPAQAPRQIDPVMNTCATPGSTLTPPVAPNQYQEFGGRPRWHRAESTAQRLSSLGPKISNMRKTRVLLNT